MAVLAQLGQPLYGCQTPDGWHDTEADWLNPNAITQRVNFATALASGKLPLQRVDDPDAPRRRNGMKAMERQTDRAMARDQAVEGSTPPVDAGDAAGHAGPGHLGQDPRRRRRRAARAARRAGAGQPRLHAPLNQETPPCNADNSCRRPRPPASRWTAVGRTAFAATAAQAGQAAARQQAAGRRVPARRRRRPQRRRAVQRGRVLRSSARRSRWRGPARTAACSTSTATSASTRTWRR